MSMNFHIAITLFNFIIGESIGLWFVTNKLIIRKKIDCCLVVIPSKCTQYCVNILNVPIMPQYCL